MDEEAAQEDMDDEEETDKAQRVEGDGDEDVFMLVRFVVGDFWGGNREGEEREQRTATLAHNQGATATAATAFWQLLTVADDGSIRCGACACVCECARS